jgi:hypothetical protein
MSRQSVIPLLLVSLLWGACRSGPEPPDPASFGPVEERVKQDPRTIIFHNESVEMAALEIFAPVRSPADCMSEAPHRLLCPADYTTLFKGKVYPRTEAKTAYPTKLSMDCAQVWVRVHTRAMAADEFREAIFRLTGKEALVLRLSEGEAARLDQDDLSARNQFPPPLRYCNPDQPDQTEAPKETSRSDQEVAKAMAAAREGIAACCRTTTCRGILQATLTLQRDGTVLRHQVEGTKGKAPVPCLVGVLAGLRFSGFTPRLTSAAVTLKLPPGR